MSQQLVKKGVNGKYSDVNPKSWTEAIKDKNTGQTLVEILQGFNMYFLSYTGDKESTRCLVPNIIRKKGLWITYVDYDNIVHTEWYAANSIGDTSWRDSSNWRIGNNMLVGDISISSKGNWVINGKETSYKAIGERGYTPILRVGSNNKLQVSYDEGYTYSNVSEDNIITQFKVIDNKLNSSTDLGKTWNPVSDYIASWIRWQATTGDTQANNVGRMQISKDNKTWTNLSNDIINNLHISKYIGADEPLPTIGIAEGTIYAKGPTYAEDDSLNENPIYRLWVYAWKDNTLAWQDNGEFQSIAAGVVQETGDSENAVMSQKAVSEKFSELEQENEKNKEVTTKIQGNVNNALSRLDGLDSSLQDRNGEQLYITDKHGNILAEFNKQGINSIGFFEKGERLKQGVEGVSDKYDDGFYITDLNGNVIATIDKNGIDSVGFFEKGKKLGGGIEGILDVYDNEFHIVDAKGNIVLTVNKNGLKTIGLSTGEFKKNVWGNKVIATYGDSITALNGGDFTYPYGEEATKASWAGKVAKYFDFAKIHNRGIGSTTYKYYDVNGGQVAWCKTETGEYVSRNDSYNYDNYQGNVTIPSDCTAIRGSGSSWLRIKTMFPESIKDSIDVLLIQYHNDYHQDMNTACSWVEGSSYDPEWAASEYYQTYGGDYNIQTVQGGIASTIMKFQAWMPNTLIVLMTPISGVYTNGNGDVKEIENVESAKMRKLAEVVKDIAFKMSIPCIDVYGNDGINTLNHKLNGYITDGIHPYSDAGCKKIARAVISGLDSIIPNIN